MGAIRGCTGACFAYSPHSYMQGRVGESSPALLCLGFAFETLDLTQGDADATGAKFGDLQFAISAKSPEEHGGDFPAFAEFGGGEVSDGGGL
jgi:hypothetical protein